MKLRYLVGLLLMLLAACTPGTSSTGAVPLAEGKPTFLFFYTDN